MARHPSLIFPTSQSFTLISIPRALLSDFSTGPNESRAEGRMRHCFSCRTLVAGVRVLADFQGPKKEVLMLEFLGTFTGDWLLKCHLSHTHLRRELSNKDKSLFLIIWVMSTIMIPIIWAPPPSKHFKTWNILAQVSFSEHKATWPTMEDRYSICSV